MGPLAAVNRGARRAHALGIRAVARLAVFLAARDVTALAQVNRALLERYLADLHRELRRAGHPGQADRPDGGVPHRYPPAWLGRRAAA